MSQEIAMATYVLIGLSLSLVGVAGLQFFYLMYLEWEKKQHLKRIKELEHFNRTLSDGLYKANRKVAELTAKGEFISDEIEDSNEVWADVIEDA